MMSKLSSEVGTILGGLNFISERAILGGIYFGSFCFGFVLADSQIKSDTYLWLAGMFFFLGLIISNISYELLLTPLRWFSEPVVLRSFHKMVKKTPDETNIKEYNDLRKFRESYLTSNRPNHLKRLIWKEIRLRKILSYLLSSNILILAILLLAKQASGISKDILQIETQIAAYTLVATIFGEVSRSQSIGRSVGLAYLDYFGTNADSKEISRLGDVKTGPVLCLDFDGVLHWYRRGWKSATVIDDIPVPGAIDFVDSAMKHFDVVISSSRCRFPGGIEAIHDWLAKNGFPEIKVIAEKPAAHVVIDDRAYLFTGQWPDMKELLEFKPWNAVTTKEAA